MPALDATPSPIPQDHDTIFVDTGVYNLFSNVRLEAGNSGITIQGAVGADSQTVLDRGNTATGSYVFDHKFKTRLGGAPTILRMKCVNKHWFEIYFNQRFRRRITLVF